MSPTAKSALLFFLILVLLFQVALLSGFYWFSRYGDAPAVAVPGSKALGQSVVPVPTLVQGAQSGESVLVSCDTEALAMAVAKVRTAVVYITGHRSSPASATPGESVSFSPMVPTGDKMGSGILFDARGYILTNNHVIANTSDLRARIFGDQENAYPCEIIAADPVLDLAVIKISAPFPFPAATLGNSDMLEVGDSVLAVGCPFNLEQSVTHGIVSDVKRDVTIDGRMYHDLLQTDAAINSGNSGGALINEDGEVIGVNVAIYAPNRVYCGVGFAIPINQAKLMMMKIKYLESGSGG